MGEFLFARFLVVWCLPWLILWVMLFCAVGIVFVWLASWLVVLTDVLWLIVVGCIYVVCLLFINLLHVLVLGFYLLSAVWFLVLCAKWCLYVFGCFLWLANSFGCLLVAVGSRCLRSGGFRWFVGNFVGWCFVMMVVVRLCLA